MKRLIFKTAGAVLIWIATKLEGISCIIGITGDKLEVRQYQLITKEGE